MMDPASLIEALDIHRPFQSIFASLENGFAAAPDGFVDAFQRSHFTASRVCIQARAAPTWSELIAGRPQRCSHNAIAGWLHAVNAMLSV